MFKIIKKYLQKESLLAQAYSETETMLMTCQEMYEETVRSLRYSDNAELKIDIYKKDKLINRYQQEIRRKMMTHLSVSSQKEISTALVMTSIVIDVERIGDYTKNIEDLAIHHPQRLNVGQYEETLKKLEDEVKSKFESVTSAFTVYDIEAASGVMDEHRSITKQCDIILNELVTQKFENIPSNDLVALALFIRYLKRISAHLTNIVSSVVNPFEKIGFKKEDFDLD